MSTARVGYLPMCTLGQPNAEIFFFWGGGGGLLEYDGKERRDGSLRHIL